VVSVATRQPENPNELGRRLRCELELIRGNAPGHCNNINRRQSARSPLFRNDSMLGQLGFEGLDSARRRSPRDCAVSRESSAARQPASAFGKVVICSGHMIDKPERLTRAFCQQGGGGCGRNRKAACRLTRQRRSRHLWRAWERHPFAEECRNAALPALTLRCRARILCRSRSPLAGNDWAAVS
jgi:hypothetical protein